MNDKIAKGPTTLFSWSVTIKIGAALAVAVLLFTFVYWIANDSWRPVLIFFGAAVLAAGQLAAAFYAARTLQLAVDIEGRRLLVEQRLEKDAKAGLSYEFGTRWTDASMFHIRMHFQEVLEKGMREKDTVSNFIDEKPDRKANVGNLLNFLEGLALSVNMQRCDEEIAKRIFCGVVLNIWNVAQPWVSHQRTARGRPQLWIELQQLHTRWSQ